MAVVTKTYSLGGVMPGRLFMYETKMDGKPYIAIGKVLAHKQADSGAWVTTYEDEHGHIRQLDSSFLVTPE